MILTAEIHNKRTAYIQILKLVNHLEFFSKNDILILVMQIHLDMAIIPRLIHSANTFIYVKSRLYAMYIKLDLQYLGMYVNYKNEMHRICKLTLLAFKCDVSQLCSYYTQAEIL